MKFDSFAVGCFYLRTRPALTSICSGRFHDHLEVCLVEITIHQSAMFTPTAVSAFFDQAADPIPV